MSESLAAAGASRAHRKRELDAPAVADAYSLVWWPRTSTALMASAAVQPGSTLRDVEHAADSVLLTLGRASDARTERIPRVVDEQSLQGEGCGPPSLVGLCVQPPRGLEDRTRLQVVEDAPPGAPAADRRDTEKFSRGRRS